MSTSYIVAVIENDKPRDYITDVRQIKPCKKYPHIVEYTDYRYTSRRRTATRFADKAAAQRLARLARAEEHYVADYYNGTRPVIAVVPV